jgi:hypothetical protein
MTGDLNSLLLWYRVVCVVCSIATTAVPILYSLTPWRTRLFGKLFMVQAISFAIAMDLTTLFAFWRPTNILFRFWVGIGVLSLIGMSTSAIAIMMFVIPYRVRRNVRNDFQQEGV